MLKRVFAAFAVIALAIPPAALAADATVPPAIASAVAYVVCDDRQGTGTLINAVQGYVLTAGHVAMDIETRKNAESCSVGFSTDASLKPKAFYKATVVKAVFDERTERDFAVLATGAHLSGPQGLPAPLKTDEFALPGEPVKVLGFPNGSQTLQQSDGFINGYDRGSLSGSAGIAEGNSGGPVVDGEGNLVGVATRVTYYVDDATGQKTVSHYESGDILGFLNWLDVTGTGNHDPFVTHADPVRFDGAPYVSRVESPGCDYVVRTTDLPTLFCLLPNGDRLVFPNEATFFSWYPDYAVVRYAAAKDLASYRLVGNVTYKAGALVKITTDPRVYVVTDSFGTLRWIPGEERAAQVFGSGWAGKVRDVPDVFFTDYAVRDAIK